MVLYVTHCIMFKIYIDINYGTALLIEYELGELINNYLLRM